MHLADSKQSCCWPHHETAKAQLLPVWVQPELKGAAGSKQDTQQHMHVLVSCMFLQSSTCMFLSVA
jgi:hypothetical protein